MQAYEFTPEAINRLNVYAESILPAFPVTTYLLLHPEVQVPFGCLPIQIIQYANGDPHVAPLHWAIYIPTLPIPGIGHHYELVGQSPQHRVQRTLDDYNARRGLEQGCHTIGYVLPAMLPHLDSHFRRTPMSHLAGPWSSQHWVWHALQGLNHPNMYAVGMALDPLVIQMEAVAADWKLTTAG